MAVLGGVDRLVGGVGRLIGRVGRLVGGVGRRRCSEEPGFRLRAVRRYRVRSTPGDALALISGSLVRGRLFRGGTISGETVISGTTSRLAGAGRWIK
ncbi:hypothetical protein CI784_13455 [Arthrobacter agilis]|nr:hypothetical protein CI784_13455 [Arthrobacter agilis]